MYHIYDEVCSQFVNITNMVTFSENIEAFELSEFLASIMNNEFDTIPDDGSLLLVCALDH